MALPPLDDLSPFPFGMHKDKPMQDVPAKYLLWLWNEGMDSLYGMPLITNRYQVADYIGKNMTAIQMDDQDTIVKNKPSK